MTWKLSNWFSGRNRFYWALAAVMIVIGAVFIPFSDTTSGPGKERCYAGMLNLEVRLQDKLESFDVPPPSIELEQVGSARCRVSRTNYMLLYRPLSGKSYAFVILCPVHTNNVVKCIGPSD